MFSIHTERNVTVCLKFTQQVEFGSLCGAAEKQGSGGNTGQGTTGQRRWKILVKKQML